MVRGTASNSEAEIVADIREFILAAPLELDTENLDVQLEANVGDGRRIDIEIGSAVIEVKRNIASEAVAREAVQQLSGYVTTRMAQTGNRYVGLLTDGTRWRCYHAIDGSLHRVTELTVRDDAESAEKLCVWLEGVLATNTGLSATAENVERRLGFQSTSYLLDRATVRSLYEQNKSNPTVQMKRKLWARLLTSALGSQFTDDDELFIEHTLLVNSAEIIAHAVLGLDVKNENPTSLLTGAVFDRSEVYGVVEADFFDWVVEVENGENFIRTLAKRLDRFDWGSVEQDILKVLYESIIPPDTRKALGEYYTPDWLAKRIVDETITNPLAQRVLDPACGSGTFLFYAVRKYLHAAENEGLSTKDALDGLTAHVIGTDLHPVAVTLARVTYVLAIGRERLKGERGSIQIPIYLGDSLQWQEQNTELFNAGLIVIEADDQRELIASQLKFPDELLEDAPKFDRLVVEMAERASNKRPTGPIPSLRPVFNRLGISEHHRAIIDDTFATMCRLHDEGRDHIWGYYIRNLARPMWLARNPNQVDCLIGNPPWLAFRFMSDDMKRTFQRMSEARGLWYGRESATHQDLSGLFLVRACELYLKKGGKFAFVLPNAAIDREHFSGLRAAEYGDASGSLKLDFEVSWDLRNVRPHIFPRASCVLFGARSDDAVPLGLETMSWSGKPGCGANGDASLRMDRATAVLVDRNRRSTYAEWFTQGAILAPRFLFHANEVEAPAIGLPSGRKSVRSNRSQHESKEWRDYPDLEGVIEAEFLKPVVNGENLYPFMLKGASTAVIPATKNRLLASATERSSYPYLENWWTQAEQLWRDGRKSAALDLIDQLDYHNKLSKQLPLTRNRIVYPTSGMNLYAAKLDDGASLVQSGLYWAGAPSEAEADYLVALLNATKTTELVRPYMAYGKDERHIHKHVWHVLFPSFDPKNASHQEVVKLGKTLEKLVMLSPPDTGKYFVTERKRIRAMLHDTYRRYQHLDKYTL